MDNPMELVLALLIGVSLSAACGFRIFVPPLVISIAAQAGHLELADGFAWMATPAATIAFGIATVVEVTGYFVPWVDNLLDTMSVPAAAVAGTFMTASMVTDVSPLLQWSLAAVVGGGVATTVSAGTAVARGHSTTFTLGFANPAVSLLELVLAGGLSVGAAIVPVLSLVFVGALLLLCAFLIGRSLLRNRDESPRVIVVKKGMGMA